MKFICASGNMIVAEEDGKYYVATAEHPVWVQIRSSSDGLRGKVLAPRPAWDKLVSEGGKISDTPCSDAIMEAALKSVNKLAMPEKASEKLHVAIVSDSLDYFQELFYGLKRGFMPCKTVTTLDGEHVVYFETDAFTWTTVDSHRSSAYNKFDVAVRTGSSFDDDDVWRFILKGLSDPFPNSKGAVLKVKELLPKGWKEIHTRASKYRTTTGSLDSLV